MTKHEYYRRLWEIFRNYKKKATFLPYLPIRLWVELREKAAQGDIGDLKPRSGCDRPWRDTFLGVPREYIWKLLLKKMP